MVTGVAVKRARSRDLADPLLVGEGGVRPDQHLDLDGRVRHAVIAEGIY